ncbi:MAG: preprotein translocase subunit SecG [Kiritimatiellaceae bacterium]|nr:preprotein translocase subunit SecG [Kiritimatiellaceae bacterium]|tara:strand:+ start:1274 stop:1624 length:351 start_codon:yes stop_codon:yes gene_type:complete
MLVMKALLLIVLVLCSVSLIGLILLQRSKSEGLGMAFGASTGESLFGARAGNVLTRATVVLGAVFMVCALLLGVLYAQQDRSLMSDVGSDPVAEVQPLPLEPISVEPLGEAPAETP